ncbi:hypothetical protein MUN84_04490 [Hymenobacter sp. 5516J-16]|uniref:Uncharacterized protein n=1 Tax=Hymenobacter sublimis TaxID=2933777 RepID=A0ABY4J7S4_9BACT|nr:MULTISPECIES: hypothetical protein [Hymenobacter]UOQ77907.1 hypothetical protein MUN84_04490 [Hymenobacter sp. 5516J-16]UPL47891.1 hypothetical protein MWH26_11865 [Hymenobacter sublimis]
MLLVAPGPFALARTFVFRRYLTLRSHVVRPVAAPPVVDAARKARKLLKKRAKEERLRNFFGWCEGCGAYGSIF